jgi:class 3 adenylate cyclase
MTVHSSYQDYRETLGRKRLVTATIIVLCAVLASSFVEYLFRPEWSRSTSIERFVFCSFLVVFLVAGRRLYQSLGGLRLNSMFTLLVGGHICWVVSQTGLERSPSNSWLGMLIVGVALLFPFSGFETARVGILLLLGYLGMIILGGHSVEWVEASYNIVFLTVAVMVAITASVLTHNLRYREFLARISLKKAHRRADDLLKNMLPEAIAERLQNEHSIIADGVAEVTVLFADLVGFTEATSTMSPDQVVEELNELFSAFDDLAERHQVNKIKTIGDAYMAASGSIHIGPGHADNMARFALGVLDLMTDFKGADASWRGIRIGMHSGPLVAGVIGKTRLTYDLWGDTVNIASRMESHGVENAIQVSEAVHRLLKEDFLLEARGTIPIRGKGDMNTWLLISERGMAGAVGDEADPKQ